MSRHRRVRIEYCAGTRQLTGLIVIALVAAHSGACSGADDWSQPATAGAPGSTSAQPEASLSESEAGRASTRSDATARPPSSRTTASAIATVGRNPTAGGSDAAGFDRSLFANPPLEYAPGIRWLWPGGAVDDVTIRAEVASFREAGYGMFEVQPVVASFDPADDAAEPDVRRVGEPAFLEHVRVATKAAHEAGMRAELTLGSGWPSGGPGVPREAQEQHLIMERNDVTGPGAVDLQLPAAEEPSWVADANNLIPNLKFVGPFDPGAELVAVAAAPLLAGAEGETIGEPVDLTSRVTNGRLQWDAPPGRHAVLTFYRNTTSHNVFIGAFPGTANDARVVDHLGPAGAGWLIEQQMNPWLRALGADKPDAWFIDSFELVGELPWSTLLAERYREHVGRDVTVDLPYVLRANGETKYIDITREQLTPAFAAADPVRASRAREDYEHARADVFREKFLEAVDRASREQGVDTRVQAHGGWGVVLDDYASVAIPEAESLYAGGSFDFLTLAGSAAHVAGKRIVSAETFVTLNLIADPFDLDTCWQFVGLLFSAGVTRPVHSCHLYPYTRADGSRWAALDTNPDIPGGVTAPLEPGSDAWSFLPAFNRAQARVGYALSRGEPRTDVAWLMTAREFRDHAQLAIGTIGAIAPEGADSASLRSAGFTYDRLSPKQLAAASIEAPGTDSMARIHVGAASYRAVIVDNARAIDPEVIEQLLAAAAGGVTVVWSGDAPARALGSVDAAKRDARVASAWSSLESRSERVPQLDAAADALRKRGIEPEIEAHGLLGTLGVLQRAAANGRLVWIFNPSPVPDLVTLTARIPFSTAEWLEPDTGASTPVAVERSGATATMTLTLAAARGGVLFLPN